MSEVTKTIEFSSEHKQMVRETAEKLVRLVDEFRVDVPVLNNEHYPLLFRVDHLLDVVANLDMALDHLIDGDCIFDAPIDKGGA